MAKKPMTIDNALRWAYREELPKRDYGAAAAASWLATYAELGTRVDLNRFDVVPAAIAEGDPHPDAIALWRAAQGLDDLGLEAPEGWNPIADLGDLGPLGPAAVARALEAETIVDAGGARRFKMKPSRLIVHFAVMGDRQEWRCDKPTLRPVMVNGTPAWFRRERYWCDGGRRREHGLGHWVEREVSGFNPKSRRPMADAYRKFTLEPDPHAAIVARMEWQVWRSALDLLAVEVALETIALLPSALPQWPWEEAGRTPRVLPALALAPAVAAKPARRRRRARDARSGAENNEMSGRF